MWSLKIMNSTSGFFSASQRRTGSYPAKIGAHTGSCCLLASSAKPMVGVCEEAMPPTIVATASAPPDVEAAALVEREAALGDALEPAAGTQISAEGIEVEAVEIGLAARARRGERAHHLLRAVLGRERRDRARARSQRAD